MKILNQLIIVAISGITTSHAFSATPSLQSLLATHQDGIASLKTVASAITTDETILPTNDVFYLRYLLEPAYATDDERTAALKSNLEWRMTDGKPIVTSAHSALQSAISDGKWNNDPVLKAAPHASTINNFITPKQCITTTLPSTNDLVYCVRAGYIDDTGLMSQVSVDQMVEFFLYCKEVNAMVADMRSLTTDSLIKVVTCNDLSGVKLIGGSKDFRSSLSAASTKANTLYPSMSGRTLLLNLPTILGALVKLFTPLFPAAVRQRLKFVSGPLKNVEDLREIVEGGKGRGKFVEEVNALAYGE